MKKLLLIFTFIFSLYNCNGQDSAKKRTFKIPKDQFILDSASVSTKLNFFKVVVLEKSELKNKDNAQHNSNSIIILAKEKGKYFKRFQNNKLVFAYDDNCPADGYGSIAVKNNYFTVEQTFCVDFLFVNSYTTFKIDDNGIINLHKYGEEYSDRSDPEKKIPSKIWTKKDFSVINFEEVTETFLLKLRLSKPKK
jgi:hypothetical protein